jgi:hypothetical protein
MNPRTVMSGAFPVAIAVDPTSSYVYVANNADSSVAQFTGGTDGAPKSMSPAVAAAGSGITTAY